MCKENIKEENSVLELVRRLINSSTSSINANPKPKKCMTNYCKIFNGCYDCWKSSNNETLGTGHLSIESTF